MLVEKKPATKVDYKSLFSALCAANDHRIRRMRGDPSKCWTDEDYKLVKEKGGFPYIPMRTHSLMIGLQIANKAADPMPEHVVARTDEEEAEARTRFPLLPVLRRPLIDDPLCRHRTGYNKYFIDAGCGPGEVMALAKEVGFTVVEGVELNPALVKKGRKKFSAIYEQDLTTFDYSTYNVVYAYRPLMGKAWVEFCGKVAAAAPVGQVLFSAEGPWHIPRADDGKWEVVASGYSGHYSYTLGDHWKRIEEDKVVPDLAGQIIKRVA